MCDYKIPCSEEKIIRKYQEHSFLNISRFTPQWVFTSTFKKLDSSAPTSGAGENQSSSKKILLELIKRGSKVHKNNMSRKLALKINQ